MAEGVARDWRAQFAPFSYTIALATAAAGLYLATPAGAAVNLPSGTAALVGAYLVYSGLVLATETARFTERLNLLLARLLAALVLGDMAALATGFVSTALAIQALLANPPKFIFALLAIPALAALAQSPFMRMRSARHAADDANDETTSHSGKSATGAILLVSLVEGLWMAIYVGTFFLWMGVGIGCYQILHAILLQGVSVDNLQFAAVLRQTLLRIGPQVIATVVAVAGITFAIGIVLALLRWLPTIGRTDTDRDLSQHEIGFIDKSTDAVRQYARENGYDASSLRTLLATIVAFVVFGAVTAGTAWEILAWKLAPPPGTWILVIAPPAGPGLLSGIFLVILLTALPGWVLSLASRRYLERASFRSMTSKKSGFITLKGRLTKVVRLGTLDSFAAFDAGKFLRDAYWSQARYWLVAIAMLAPATAFFTYHDAQRFTLFARDHVEVTDYWTLRRIDFRYQSVRNVELRCSFDKDHKASLTYAINLPQGYSIDLVDGIFRQKNFKTHLAIDETLGTLHKTFWFPMRKPLFQPPVSDYDPDCVEKLAGEFPPGDAQDLRQLAHLAQWQATNPAN